MAYRNETIDDLATRLATVTAQLAACRRGERAFNLSGANLSEANLSGANPMLLALCERAARVYAEAHPATATGDTQTEPATQYAFEHEDLEVVDGR